MAWWALETAGAHAVESDDVVSDGIACRTGTDDLRIVGVRGIGVRSCRGVEDGTRWAESRPRPVVVFVEHP